MSDLYSIIIAILIIFNILFLVIGFILGRIWSINGVNNNDKPKSFLKSKENKIESVSIDEKVYVTDIKTDGMTKKYDDLGEVKRSDENISSSINKLKQMKG